MSLRRRALGLAILFAFLAGSAAASVEIVCGGEEKRAALEAVVKGEASEVWTRPGKIAGIEFKRLAVEADCDVAVRWLELAEAYAGARKYEEALAVAGYAFWRMPNGFYRAVLAGESILPQTPGFAESTWGRLWAEALAKRDRRVARGREEHAGDPPDQAPPEPVLTGESCPTSCCKFGEWKLEGLEIEFFAAPGGASIGRRVFEAETVVVERGEVQVWPRRLLAQRPIVLDSEGEKVPVAAGEVIYVLADSGGVSLVWYRGRRAQIDIFELYPDACLEITETCWGDFLDPYREGDPEADPPMDRSYLFWILVRFADGTEAWAHADQIDGVDCERC